MSEMARSALLALLLGLGAMGAHAAPRAMGVAPHEQDPSPCAALVARLPNLQQALCEAAALKP
ncbi:MAG: hypothetical protein AB7S86_16515, partial [Hydrogenophaga sp.]